MKITIIKKLVQQSRLDEYRKILDLAINHDYFITSLSDWYEHDFYQDKKVLILRHDVDYNPHAAYKMFKIEKERNVMSTFYFRWSTVDMKVISALVANGFEVSLHYETLATFCRAKKIQIGKQITDEILTECRSLLTDEVKKFEMNYIKPKTLCSHGERINMKLGIPNHALMTDKSYKNLGIYFETYDPEILQRFTAYISDASIKAGQKWKYGKTPAEEIQAGSKCICLLTHPHHWDHNLRNNINMILIELKQKFKE
jgi:hypothetical protein